MDLEYKKLGPFLLGTYSNTVSQKNLHVFLNDENWKRNTLGCNSPFQAILQKGSHPLYVQVCHIDQSINLILQYSKSCNQ